MRIESHVSIAKTTVRDGAMQKHFAHEIEPDAVFAVISGLGMPRTWPLATGAALDGFAAGMAEAKNDPGVARLHEGLRAARAELAKTCDQLVERILPDAALTAMFIQDDHVHVMAAGSGRVYLQRGGKPERLTSRDAVTGGLLRARPSQCSTALQAGDLVLAGSVSAFSTKAIAKVVQVLEADPKARPSVLASLLTEPAMQAGAGAAALVVRFR